jgi:hypothetical protein
MGPSLGVTRPHAHNRAKQRGAIARAIANERHRFHAERRGHDFADLAIRDGPPVIVKNFNVQVVPHASVRLRPRRIRKANWPVRSRRKSHKFARPRPVWMARPEAFKASDGSFRTGSPMQIAFLTEQFFKSNPVSRAFSATCRRKDGTADDGGRLQRARWFPKRSVGRGAPTRTTAQPSSRRPRSVGESGDETAVQRHGHQHRVARGQSGALEGEFFVAREPAQRPFPSTSRADGWPVVPLVVTISTTRSRGTQRKSRLRSDKVLLVHQRHLVQRRHDRSEAAK